MVPFCGTFTNSKNCFWPPIAAEAFVATLPPPLGHYLNIASLHPINADAKACNSDNI